jgi:hypothetical protein
LNSRSAFAPGIILAVGESESLCSRQLRSEAPIQRQNVMRTGGSN